MSQTMVNNTENLVVVLPGLGRGAAPLQTAKLCAEPPPFRSRHGTVTRLSSVADQKSALPEPVSFRCRHPKILLIFVAVGYIWSRV